MIDDIIVILFDDMFVIFFVNVHFKFILFLIIHFKLILILIVQFKLVVAQKMVDFQYSLIKSINDFEKIFVKMKDVGVVFVH